MTANIHPLMLLLNLSLCFTISSIGVGWLWIARAIAGKNDAQARKTLCEAGKVDR